MGQKLQKQQQNAHRCDTNL